MGFQVPQHKIATLLEWAATGKLQLPDFQREYKWNDERIRQLLVTIVRDHPMGVIMLLETGNDQVRFKPKPITGVTSPTSDASYLLLDGQQRMTSMYQALTGTGVVETQNDRKQRLRQRYFLDIEKFVGNSRDQEDAVISVPENGKILANFDRDVRLDVSTVELQQRQGFLPMTELFSPTLPLWLIAYSEAVPEERDHRLKIFTQFQTWVAGKVLAYGIPAIQLDSTTSKEAVATVFEKVNTGGLALDVFELLTATFAGDAEYFQATGTDFRLAEDWKLTEAILTAHSVLSVVQRSDFLQGVALLTTYARHTADVAAGKARPSATSARREDILRLELTDYLEWAPKLRESLTWVAHFLTAQHIHTAGFLPYRTQLIPLAVFRTLLGPEIDTYAVRNRIAQWYWCGVLGELYGSATETRFARDTEQVPIWAKAGITGETTAVPDTVKSAAFRETRLLSLRTRGSAAYKGIYALVLADSCRDWRLDQQIEHSTYLSMRVDIHHIFPRAWCERNKIEAHLRESIVNKTPLAKETNIFLRGDSPATYLTRLQKSIGLAPDAIDTILREHLIEPEYLRKTDFDAFFEARWQALLAVIEKAMGKPPIRDYDEVFGDEIPGETDGYEDEPDDPEDGADEDTSYRTAD